MVPRAGRGKETGRRILEEHYNLEDALVVATFLNAFVNHADVVKIANMAQLVNVIAPIFTNEKGLYLQTIYHPLQLFANNSRGKALELFVDSPTYKCRRFDGVPYLDASAALDNGTLVMNAVNRHRRRGARGGVRDGGQGVCGAGGSYRSEWAGYQIGERFRAAHGKPGDAHSLGRRAQAALPPAAAFLHHAEGQAELSAPPRRHAEGYFPNSRRQKPCTRCGHAASGKNIIGHSPATVRIPFDWQKLKAAGLTAPAPPARYIQTRAMPAWAHSSTTCSVTDGLVISSAASTGGWTSWSRGAQATPSTSETPGLTGTTS